MPTNVILYLIQCIRITRTRVLVVFDSSLSGYRNAPDYLISIALTYSLSGVFVFVRLCVDVSSDTADDVQRRPRPAVVGMATEGVATSP